MDYFIKAVKQYADFSGRARRKEYWMYTLFYMIFYIVAGIIDGLMSTVIFASVFSLALLVPSIAIAARRLHDTGRSGWWQLLHLLPLIGTIVLIVFLAQDSHDENDYGPSPKLTAS